MRTLLASCVALLGLSCSHPQNLERKDPLTDEVTGALQPTDRAFLKDDPATRVACRADAQCPKGDMCHPQKQVCITGYPEMQMTKIEVTCPLVPLYFAFDSTELVPDAHKWVDHDAACLKARGAKSVELKGFADARGDTGYNVDLSQRRAEAVKEALSQRGLTVDVAVKGEGATDPVLNGTSEHDYAYNRRVELKSK
jgi:outer membrane protein OmpA-like peptidoglycan-associated protein